MFLRSDISGRKYIKSYGACAVRYSVATTLYPVISPGRGFRMTSDAEVMDLVSQTFSFVRSSNLRAVVPAINLDGQHGP